MDTKAKDSPITQKTLELCQAITEQADFLTLKQKLDAFMADELVKFDYQQVNSLGNLLQSKQTNGVELTPEEVAKFEDLRQKLLSNPVAQGFMDAQVQLQQLHEVIGNFLNKTFELGRRPEYEDVHDGSCGDCGCH
jgi:cell fate (sporulation/competence/biofilm development) regulator YlbF (YheA/YmcA/DUF963 family)